MKKLPLILITVVVTSLAIGAADTAVAANTAGKVTVKKIGNKTAPHGKKVTIKPIVSGSGQVVLGKPLLTVKHGKKVVAKNARYARLKPGKYSVTSRVGYKTFLYKTREVPETSQVYSSGDVVLATCSISSISPLEDASHTFLAECSGSDFDGEFGISGNASAAGDDDPGTWNLSPGGPVSAGTEPTSLVGVAFTGEVQASRNLLRTTYRSETYRRYSKYLVKKRTQKLTIRRQVSMTPSGWDCPSWAPIKGNAESMIYHMPSGAYYDATKPERCFATQAAAVNEGFRKSKR